MESQNLKKIHLIATGGTIASEARSRVSTEGYKPSVIPVEELVAQIPELSEIAVMSSEQIFLKPSSAITDSDLFDLSARINELLASDDCDGIIVGFPIYFSGVAGQGKAFLDRLYPMMDANFIPRHPGKKVIAVYAQGDPREQAFAPAINSANYVFRMCGWKLIDSILCAGTSSPDFIIPDNLINRAKTAAEKL